jgi:hypothetical protein
MLAAKAVTVIEDTNVELQRISFATRPQDHKTCCRLVTGPGRKRAQLGAAVFK